MKNKCIYTEEIMKEYHYASMLYYFKKHFITLLVLLVLAFINFIVKLSTHNVSINTIFFMIFPILFFLVIIAKEKRGYKIEEILDGRMFIPLSKNGFIDGDAESCKKFLDSKIK